MRFVPRACGLFAAALLLPMFPVFADPAAAPAPPPVTPPPAAPAAPLPSPSAPPKAAAPAPPVPEGMRAYADVIKGAKEQKGLFTVYQNDRGELLLAVRPDQMDRDYILATAVATGLGVEGLYSGVDLGNNLIRFHRVNGQMLLVERNLNFRAKPNTPEETAVERSFSDSTLAGIKIEAIDPASNSLLLNVTSLFLSDLPMLGPGLTQGLGTAYNLDPSRSYFSSVKSLPENLEVESDDAFAASRPASTAVIPDGRSLSVHIHYSLFSVPEDTGYVPRLADTRVGYFVTAYKDLSNDSTRDPFVRYIDRWDVRKLYPDRPLSPPVHPIVYWLDDAIPDQYRPAITAGVLRWNKAFEKIGIEDAIQVRQRPANADWDISDARYNVIRWFNADEGAPAIGMHRVNPYTGQTIGATIVINDGFARYWKTYYHDYIARLTNGQPFASPVEPPAVSGDECDYAAESIPEFAELANAYMLLTPTPSDTVPEAIVDQYLSEVACHETGHTLGLRHNFKGSTMLSFKSLFDTSITHRIGTTSSVMDYMPPLIALPGQKQGDYYTTTIGAYDYWAIQYGYSTLPGASPAQVSSKLDQIASRSSNPYLQYATDEDTGGVDPTAALWDYGRDPLDFSDHDIALAHVLFKRIAQRIPQKGRTYDDAFSAYTSTIGMYIGAFNTPLRFIGGSYLHRDHAGEPAARLPVQPVPAATQVRALKIITGNLFDDSALRIPSSLLDRVLPDRWYHWDSTPFGPSYNPTSIRAVLLNAQRQAIDILYSPTLLSRLEDQNLDAGSHGLDVAHLVDGTTWAIWSELAHLEHLRITPLRRDTQRIHLDALISLVVSPQAGTPEDASAMGRYELRWIRDHVHATLEAHPSDLGLTAYLQDVEVRANRALNAQVIGAA